jgi:hypothetical protein
MEEGGKLFICVFIVCWEYFLLVGGKSVFENCRLTFEKKICLAERLE